jgi:hypothetical protein
MIPRICRAGLAPTSAVVRVAILATFLHGVVFAQTVPATMCTFSNGLAEGFFGGVTISGFFTQGLLPADISNITVNDLQVGGNYTFTGPLNGLGYVTVSQIIVPCVLAGCTPGTTVTGSAGLHLVPDRGNTVILLDFVDSGEDFTGSGPLSCSAFPARPPSNNPPQVCPMNVIQSPGGPTSGDGMPTTMNGNYTPVVNGVQIGLGSAASMCGVDSFNFVQQVNSTAHPPRDYMLNVVTPPSPDPPPGGLCNIGDDSKSPDGCVSGGPTDNSFPFYWKQSSLQGGSANCAGSPSLIETPITLLFQDCPFDMDLVKSDTATSFTTMLVGVSGTCTAGSTMTTGCAASQILYSWSWTSSYNGSPTGSAGGVMKNTSPINGPSGTGGVTITAINGVQLPPAVPSGQISMTASGLAYSRVSKTFTGTVTITNVSGALINGPLQMVFFGLPATVTLVNATNNLSGTPYVTIPVPAGMAAGQSITVSVQFSNPSNAIINLTPAFYAGSF